MLLGSELTTPREYLSSLDLQWETFGQSSLKPCGPQLYIQYVAPHVSMWSELATIQGSLRRYIFQKLLLAWLFSCINKKACESRRRIPWSHFCMNILYISHRSLFAPTYSFWAIGSMLISLFRVTSWFDTVYNIVTRWVNFRENHLHEHKQQWSDYDIEVFWPKYN